MPRRSQVDLPALDALARAQHHCVTLRQLSELGLNSSTVAHRTRPEGGHWNRLLPGVVVLHRGTPTQDERLQASLLYADVGAVVTGVEALRRHGLRNLPSTDATHVLVPIERRRQSTGFVLCERTRRMPRTIHRAGFPCSPVARALVDAARRIADLAQVRAMTAEAVQRRLCTPTELLDELRRAQRRRTAQIRLVAREIVGGIRSAMEAELRRFLRALGLREPLWNHDLISAAGEFIGCPDAWFDEEGVGLEMDSREWHLDPSGWERTQRRRARFARHGVTTIPITPKRLFQQQDELAADIMGALLVASRTGRPDVTAVMHSQAA